jgi:hypothetical protein
MCGVYKSSQYLHRTDNSDGLDNKKIKDLLIMALAVVHICEYLCAV